MGASMGHLEQLVRIACTRPIVIAAIKISLIVGTVLNMVNQGGRILDGLPPSWFHVALNYFVPYCVSTYSAARNEMRRSWNHV